MRPKVRRNIGLLLPTSAGERALLSARRTTKAGASDEPTTAFVPEEFTAHQYAIFLLHIAAGIEHALMVEYLYAAFSLGGAQVPVTRRAEVSQWREIILGIAKEEMGHLMTVQNLLRCLGGPLNLDREDFPWDSDFYPFPFKLEPLTRKSLAKYVVTEAPENWTGTEADEIKAVAQQGPDGTLSIHRVGALYNTIEALLADEAAVKDADFRGSTFPFQANWDEWGRGYQGGSRGNTMEGAMPGTPDVLLLPVTSRTDSLAALKAIATQGEANLAADDNAPSHFARFLRIFRQFPKDQTWSPGRKVPVDPIVITELQQDADGEGWGGTPITDPESKIWAHLFNVRYQALLTNLLHTFEYPSNVSEVSQLTPRGLLLHSTFGEMYNIRALSEILVQRPLAAGQRESTAGPPFQIPYTLKLPVDLVDRWRLHLDLMQTSCKLAKRLLKFEPQQHSAFLQAMMGADGQTIAMIEAILVRRPTPSFAYNPH